MKRKIIKIDREKCNGCTLCVSACHEGAIGMVAGKATLLREDYCDGLGDCLPVCPTGAITFEEREAPAYDAEAVARNMQKAPLPCGCPGSAARTISPSACPPEDGAPARSVSSQLRQWPVQLHLAPVVAPHYGGAHLLVAADCAAYAYGNFHSDFMRNHITLIGCPKLDEDDYAEKLTAILRANDIASVTVVRMEVPCCGGIEAAVKNAVHACGRPLALRCVTLTTDGAVLREFNQ